MTPHQKLTRAIARSGVDTTPLHMNARSRSFGIALGALVLTVVGCSSQAPATPAPFTCNEVADAPDCPGEYEYSCTGDGELRESRTQYPGSCTAGPIGADGTKTYCCAGCDGGAGGCPTTYGWEPYTCEGAETPEGLFPERDCFQPSCDPTSYCCVERDPDNESCIAAPSVNCGVDGQVGVECGGPLPPASIGCQDGDAVVPDNEITAYCCAAGTCAETTTACGPGNVGVLYSCSGASAPSVSNSELACSEGSLQFGMDPEFAFCCLPVPLGACVADPSVPNCNSSTLLYGFSCTGSATPQAQITSLTCFPGSANADGTTQYCCGG